MEQLLLQLRELQQAQDHLKKKIEAVAKLISKVDGLKTDLDAKLQQHEREKVRFKLAPVVQLQFYREMIRFLNTLGLERALLNDELRQRETENYRYIRELKTIQAGIAAIESELAEYGKLYEFKIHD